MRIFQLFLDHRNFHDALQLLAGQEGREILKRGAEQRTVRKALGRALGLEELRGVYKNFGDKRALGRKHRIERCLDLAVLAASGIRIAVSPRKALEGREGEVAALGADTDLRVVAEDVGLRLADRMIAIVVDDDDLDGQTVGQNGLQLLQVHLDRAVTRDANDLLLTECDANADGGGQVVAHRGDCRVDDKALILLDLVAVASDDAGRAVSDHGRVALGQTGRECADEGLGIGEALGVLMTLENDGIVTLPLAAGLLPAVLGDERAVLGKTRSKRLPLNKSHTAANSFFASSQFISTGI